MQTITQLEFEIMIHASAADVWEALWNDKTYRQWTSPFHAGSYAVSDWTEGSAIDFLIPEGSGMYSRILRMIPNQEMTFEHLGEIVKGERRDVEWAGATESYLLREENGVLVLRVKTDVIEAYRDYMNNTFPKALQLVKELAEKQ
jgi:uncharacterized protein YndB with AHSA1/START domain